MSKKVTLIVEPSKLDAAIVEVSKRASSLADQIQLVLASATYQAMAHGNVNQINALISAVGRGVRKTALAQWLNTYAPVVAESDKDKAKENPFRFSKEKLADLLAAYEGERVEVALLHAETAHGKHWTEHKEPPLLPEKWDVLAQIKSLIAKGTKYEKEGVQVINAGLMASIAAMLPQGESDPAPL